MQIFRGLFNIINGYILAPVMRFIMGLCNNNFAVTILIFTVLVNALMIPLSIKSQKSSVQQIKIRPKLDELKKKYGDDRQKFAMAQQKLYQDENISMSGGCLPMLIRMLFLMSVYYLILQPISYLAGIDAATISASVEGLSAAGLWDGGSSLYNEITLIQFVQNSEKMALVTDGTLLSNLNAVLAEVRAIDFNLFGIDLTQMADFSLDVINNFNRNWIIPLLSGAAAFLSIFISSKLQKAMNPDAPNMMAMNLIMPIFSIVIAFKAPGGLGFYWACSSLVSSLVQAGVQYFYSPYKMIANERAKKLLKVNEQENKIINN